MSSESADLLDVNVWLALADENHAHHKRARRYWERESAPQLAFCRTSMLAFLRLSTNRHVMSGQPFTPAQGWTAYRNFRALPEVILLGDPPELETRMAAWSDTAEFPVARWTDCYLAALALTTACRLVSFDRDYERFKGLDFLHLKP